MSVTSLLWVLSCGLPRVRAPVEHCAQVADLCVPDWHLLPCVVSLNEVIGALPGHLGWNREETQPISTVPWVYTPLINRYVSPGVPEWSEGKTLCKECVLGLMGRRILNSLRELKAQRRSSC